MPTWIVLITVASIIGGCTIAAIAVWSESRRTEREELHRNETYQKMLESTDGSAESVMQTIREQESRRERLQRESQVLGLKMGGWITTAAGVGVAVFLYAIAPDSQVWVVGLVPLLIGVVLITFGSKLGSQLGSAAKSDY